MVINICWTGPYTPDDVARFNETQCDIGLYQTYGVHFCYGPDQLLYIGGQTTDTFAARLRVGWTAHYPDTRLIYEPHPTFYLERIGGVSIREELVRQIELAEKLVIFVHSPAYNSNFISGNTDLNDVKDVQVFNWGQHRSLLPEVSGARWTTAWDCCPGNRSQYTMHV
jgi:hypothetical protein